MSPSGTSFFRGQRSKLIMSEAALLRINVPKQGADVAVTLRLES